MAAKAKTVKPDLTSDAEGAIYVSSAGTYYTKPQIDAKAIKDCIRNNYLADQVSKLRSQIFTERYMIEVRDPDGNVDEELQSRMMRMCESPKVRLWIRMQQVWEDVWQWGCSPMNDVWEMQGAELVLTQLRRLPPESFARSPFTADLTLIYSEILQGILLDANGEMQFWQQASDYELQPKQLWNVTLMKDPTSTELAGTSKIIPLVPLIKMLDFCWQAQMQKINRVGAPTLFIKVTNPIKSKDRDDIAYANKILKNWGKGTAYQLRENMEVVELNVTDNEAALRTIDALKARIKEFFSPSELIKKEGATLGGNAMADTKLIDTWKEGQHQWIEDQFEQVLQKYLDGNAYEGFTVHVQIGAQDVSMGDLEVKQAQVGYQTQTLTVNEIREKLGEPELDDAALAKLAEDYSKAAPAASTGPAGSGGFPFQIMKAHDKEHVPTAEERMFDDQLNRTYEELQNDVVKALRNERGGAA